MKERADRIGARQGGFIKKVMLVVVLVCIVFAVFTALARYVGVGSFSSITELPSATSTSTSYAASQLPSGNNPLLGFLTNPSNDTYGRPTYGQGGSSGSQPPGQSPYAGQVYVSAGDTSTIQPSQEYVTIRNSGQGPVDITGWTLTNGKGTRPIQTSENSYIYPVADSATIGQGTEFLDPSDVFDLGPIILAPGDNAIVTTGGPFIAYPYKISTSFRENICEGYLRDYPFEPSLSRQCPYATNDPTINTVTDQCYDYMRSLSACEDPEKYDKDNFDGQTSQCQAFMTARLSYGACVAGHKSDANFSMSQWRIFLGKQREMWADSRETISLYDANNLLVDQKSY